MSISFAQPHRVFLIGTIFLLLALLLWSVLGAPRRSVLTVAFLDVGQGDSILIESPTGSQMLIDGGYDRSVLRELGKYLGVSDRTIDVVFSTHADADHIGGLRYVLDRYDVDTLFFSGIPGDSPAYHAFETARASVDTQYVTQRGEVIDVGGGAYVRVLFPDRPLSATTETNLSSAVVEVVYGDVEFLLTGDAPKNIEAHVVELEGVALESEVLKAGHHGSKTSSSPYFVDAVHPTYAVISAGKDNRYGHPHKEVLSTFQSAGAQVLGTYDRGTVVFETDGKELWLRE